MQSAHGGVRRAFTLVELLVVIGIITLLAAILVPAAYMAVQSAKNGRLALEVAGLAKALERYKMEYGEYPPDFSYTASQPVSQRAAAAQLEINDHLARIFRRRNPTDLPRDEGCTDIDQAALAQLNPANALYFWLRGFSPDPTAPLTGDGARESFFDFDRGRAVLDDAQNANAIMAYFVRPAGCQRLGWTTTYYPEGGAQPTPYLYYRAQTADGTTIYSYATSWAGSNNVAAPYVSKATQTIAEPEKFQILSAGLDGVYGPGGGIYPDGPYAREERDNITSFSGGKTLENAKP